MTPDTEKVRTLEDLRHWTRTAPSLAVVGHPVAHSKSPLMHNAALAEISKTDAKFADWRYFKFDIAPADLPEALKLFQEKNFQGLNLTIPHKVDVLPLLAEMDPFVQKCGAANTLTRKDNGWTGVNTDGAGFLSACEVMLSVEFSKTPVVIFGAGGAARAITTALQEWAPLSSITVVNRSRERIDELKRVHLGDDVTKRLSFITSDELDGIPTGALVVNCTSLGLQANDPSPVSAAFFRDGMKVYDTTYGAHESALIREARDFGLRAENGLSMLCFQGAHALFYWSHVPLGILAPTMWKALGGVGSI